MQMAHKEEERTTVEEGIMLGAQNSGNSDVCVCFRRDEEEWRIGELSQEDSTHALPAVGSLQALPGH